MSRPYRFPKAYPFKPGLHIPGAIETFFHCIGIMSLGWGAVGNDLKTVILFWT